MIKKLPCKTGNMLDISAKKAKTYYYSVQAQSGKLLSKLVKANKLTLEKTTVVKQETVVINAQKVTPPIVEPVKIAVTQPVASVVSPQPSYGGGGGGGGSSPQPAPAQVAQPVVVAPVVLVVPIQNIEPTSTIPTTTPETNTPPVVVIPPVIITEKTICSSSSQSIVLIVDPDFSNTIQTKLTQYENDLCKEYNVIEKTEKFNSPLALRSYLQDLYGKTQLVGAVFIGDYPHAYQWITLNSANPNIASMSEEALSLQYYEDLDGSFKKSENYKSLGNYEYSFDIHDGEVDWEIWVGVLPYYKGDVTATAEALNRFFDKDHVYKTSGSGIPRAFAQINEHMTFDPTDDSSFTQLLQTYRTNIYSWTPFSDSFASRFYVNGNVPEDNSIDTGYKDLTIGVADFTSIAAHGFYGGSGKTDISWVEKNSIQTIFYWNDACAIGNLDVKDNFLTSVLYKTNSEVLVAKGATNNSGGMGSNTNGFYAHNIATSLTAGKSIGQAVLDHVNVPLAYPYDQDREFLFTTFILLGDPTLKLR